MLLGSLAHLVLLHTDRQTDRRTDIQTYRRTDIQAYRHTDVQTYRRTDVQTYRRTDVQTHRRTDVQTYIHTYMHTYTHTHIHTYIHRRTHTHIYISHVSPISIIYIYIYISHVSPINMAILPRLIHRTFGGRLQPRCGGCYHLGMHQGLLPLVEETEACGVNLQLLLVLLFGSLIMSLG